MKKIISMICTVALLLTCLCGTLAEETQDDIVILRPYIDNVVSMESAEVPMYLNATDKTQNIELWFLNGISDIPYISVDTVADLLRTSAEVFGCDAYEVTEQTAGDYIFLIRDNGSVATFDLTNKTISLNDTDLFSASGWAVNGLDVIGAEPADEDGKVNLFKSVSMYYRGGKAEVYDLNDYSIYMHIEDGMAYIPLQTYVDIFGKGFNEVALYNQKCVILTSGGSLKDASTGDMTEIGKFYQNAEKHLKSDELTIFNYYELCMALDHTYGLMKEHNIESFDSFFRESGLITKLVTREAGDTYSVLTDMTLGYLADQHSAPMVISYMASEGTGGGDPLLGSGMLISTFKRVEYAQARAVYYPDGPVGYEEIGNTAYITFDSFSYDPDRDYYNTEITNTTDDTIELMLYAVQQINREDSPIENVVLDISNNGGGAVNAAIAVIACMVGNASFKLEDAFTGTESIVAYTFDANLDHTIGEGDYLHNIMGGGKRLYCLIGPSSFSCGNLVPAAFRESGSVTLIGRTSGGGACVVQGMSTADGNVFEISGSLIASTVKNGTYYSVDTGFTPDVYVDKIEHMYDRQYLTEYINSLF